jgi:hypothetical protein
MLIDFCLKIELGLIYSTNSSYFCYGTNFMHAVVESRQRPKILHVSVPVLTDGHEQY